MASFGVSIGDYTSLATLASTRTLGTKAGSPLVKTTSPDSVAWQEAFKNQGPQFERALQPNDNTFETAANFEHLQHEGPWSSMRVLSFDGGGIRGLSSLLILQDLMERIQRIETKERQPPARTSADSPEIETDQITEWMKKIPTATRYRSDQLSAFLPCHYFDVIAGTSTGGLIATMLGRLRMSVSATIYEYLDITSKVYRLQSPTTVRVLRNFVIPHKKTEKVLKFKIEHLDTGRNDTNAHENFKSDETRCKTIVCALQRSHGQSSMVPYLFRSWDYVDDLDDTAQPHLMSATTYPISEIMRATSCSPYYFRLMKLGQDKYCDAGFSLSNPSFEVFQELDLKYRPHRPSKPHRPVGLMLSIGCGTSSSNPDHTGLKRDDALRLPIFKVDNTSSDVSEAVHKLMATLHEKLETFSYFRFNATGLVISSEECSSKKGEKLVRERIESATKQYLAEIADVLERCAMELVDTRRLRSATEEWETFALGSRYKCTHPEVCEHQKNGSPPFESRNALTDHLRKVHHMSPATPEIKGRVEMGRINSD
jgi:hypothetical protein